MALHFIYLGAGTQTDLDEHEMPDRNLLEKTIASLN